MIRPGDIAKTADGTQVYVHHIETLAMVTPAGVSDRPMSIPVSNLEPVTGVARLPRGGTHEYAHLVMDVASVIERMESKRPERVIAQAVVDTVLRRLGEQT